MGVWDFIQDQVLGMKWLNELLGIGLSALGLDVNAVSYTHLMTLFSAKFGCLLRAARTLWGVPGLWRHECPPQELRC